jgi:hypothetical protein
MTNRLRIAVVLALALAFAVILATPNVGSASTPDAEPWPGNPHWSRQAGSEALVQVQVDASAKGIIPLIDDSVAMWNAQSPFMQIYRLPGGVECYFGVHCVVVAEANNYPCGGGQTYMDWNSSHHFQPALIAVNLADCGVSLLYAKYTMCHEFGHTQGLQHAGGATIGVRPCSPGDGRPTQSDLDVRNYLGVHAH